MDGINDLTENELEELYLDGNLFFELKNSMDKGIKISDEIINIIKTFIRKDLKILCEAIAYYEGRTSDEENSIPQSGYLYDEEIYENCLFILSLILLDSRFKDLSEDMIRVYNSSTDMDPDIKATTEIFIAGISIVSGNVDSLMLHKIVALSKSNNEEYRNYYDRIIENQLKSGDPSKIYLELTSNGIPVKKEILVKVLSESNNIGEDDSVKRI